MSEYESRKILKDLGYTFDGDRLDNFRANAFRIIEDQIAKERKVEERKSRRGR